MNPAQQRLLNESPKLEIPKLPLDAMPIRKIGGGFAVAQLREAKGLAAAWLEEPFVFAARTDREISVVCPQARVPGDALAWEGGWALYGVDARLHFALIGILAALTAALAQAGVSVVALSTFDTDYFLVKEAQEETARAALAGAGYMLLEAEYTA